MTCLSHQIAVPWGWRSSNLWNPRTEGAASAAAKVTGMHSPQTEQRELRGYPRTEGAASAAADMAGYPPHPEQRELRGYPRTEGAASAAADMAGNH